jgi:hypothetical protein
MAITNYTELQAAIVGWSHRADLATVIPDFITLAEAKFNDNLRTREMEASDSLTPASGVCTLPTDYLELRRLYIDTQLEVELEYLPPEQFRLKFPLNGTGAYGLSRYYTIEGESILLSDKINTSDLAILYYQTIPPLSANATNWLLSKRPDLYLSAAMAELSDYIKDASGVQKWNAKAQGIVESLISSDKRGKYSGSAMRVIAA